MKLKISRNAVKIGIVLILGIVIGHFSARYVKLAYKYFSLRGYSRLTDYKLRPKQVGEVPNFTLVDVKGDGYGLYRQSDAAAVVFISQGVGCFASTRYGYGISGLKKEY